MTIVYRCSLGIAKWYNAGKFTLRKVLMPTADNVKTEVYDAIKTLLKDKSQNVVDDMALIGEESPLESIDLIELCLVLESKAVDFGFEFDWATGAAMPKSHSIFRTASSLATEFINQMETKK